MTNHEPIEVLAQGSESRMLFVIITDNFILDLKVFTKVLNLYSCHTTVLSRFYFQQLLIGRHVIPQSIGSNHIFSTNGTA